MPEMITTEIDIADEIPSSIVTPVEYVKRANARENRIRHATDLNHFVDHLRAAVHDTPLTRIMPADLDRIIADYLDAKEQQ